jgi:hypothetical protein
MTAEATKINPERILTQEQPPSSSTKELIMPERLLNIYIYSLEDLACFLFSRSLVCEIQLST